MGDQEGKKTVTEAEAESRPEAEAGEKPSLVLASEILPERIPILPLRPRPFFPGIPVPIEISAAQMPLLDHALESSSETLGLVLVRNVKGEDTPNNLHRVG